jgi:hypothetical protein
MTEAHKFRLDNRTASSVYRFPFLRGAAALKFIESELRHFGAVAVAQLQRSSRRFKDPQLGKNKDHGYVKVWNDLCNEPRSHTDPQYDGTKVCDIAANRVELRGRATGLCVQHQELTCFIPTRANQIFAIGAVICSLKIARWYFAIFFRSSP